MQDIEVTEDDINAVGGFGDHKGAMVEKTELEKQASGGY